MGEIIQRIISEGVNVSKSPVKFKEEQPEEQIDEMYNKIYSKLKNLLFKGNQLLSQFIHLFVDVRPYFWDLIAFIQLQILQIHTAFPVPSQTRDQLTQTLQHLPLDLYLHSLTSD